MFDRIKFVGLVDDKMIGLNLIMFEIKKERRKYIKNDTLKAKVVLDYLKKITPKDKIVSFLNFNGKRTDRSVAVDKEYALIAYNHYTSNLKGDAE